MKLLDVKDLNVLYGDTQILWDLSFHIDEGEIVALLGPNGAGKSTVLKAISGIVKPVSGKIYYREMNITDYSPYQRVELGITQIPEGRLIFPRLTVYDNLRVAAYTARARKRFKETLEFIYSLFPILRERRSQLAGSLSGGEQQMLAIARGLITNPELLMLDEPSLGLAPKIVTEILSLIPKLREQGYTILLVEQNAVQSLQLVDRAYIMESGRIIKEGAGKELLNDPEVKKSYLGL